MGIPTGLRVYLVVALFCVMPGTWVGAGFGHASAPGDGGTPALGHPPGALPRLLAPAALRSPSLPAAPGVPSVPLLSPVPAAAAGVTVLYPNCTVSNLSAPIVQTGTTFNLTASFSGAVEDECAHSTFDGMGFQITALPSVEDAFEVYNTSEVNVTNLTLTGAGTGVAVLASSWIGLSGLNFLGDTWAIEVEDSSNATLVNVNGSFGPDGGLLAVDTTNVHLSDSEFGSLSGWGIIDEYSTNFTATGCYLAGVGDGAITVYASGANYSGDNLSGGYYGLYDLYSSFVSSWDDSFDDATYGILLSQSNYFSSADDHGYGTYRGISLMQVVGARVVDDSFPAATESGLWMHGASNVEVSDSDFAGSAENGTEIFSSTNVTLAAVNLSGYSDYGLDANGSLHLDLLAVDASDPAAAVRPAFGLTFDEFVTLQNCTGNASYYGIDGYGDDELSVQGGHFDRATGPQAIYLDEVDGATLVNATLVNGSSTALYVVNSEQIVARDLTVSGAVSTGVYTYGDAGLTLAGIVDRMGYENQGVFLDADSSVLLTGCWFANSTFSFSEGISTFSLQGAYIANSTFEGVNLSMQADNDYETAFVNNSFANAPIGWILQGDEQVTLEANRLVNATTPFEIANNVAVSIFHNDFVNVGIPDLLASTYDLVSFNRSYPIGGNYWSSDTGPDNDSGPGQNLSGPDGIVDTPLVLNATLRDAYPLVRPWTPYSWSFRETGLPAGRSWSVDFGGTTAWSDGPTLTFFPSNAANLSSWYSVLPVPGFSLVAGGSGGIELNGTSQRVAVTFAPFTYPVTFNETGLASGTSWSLTVANGSLSGSTGELSVPLANGSYPFEVGSVSGYALTTPSGSVTVNGSGPIVVVDYVLIRHIVVVNNTTTGGGSGGHNDHNNTTGPSGTTSTASRASSGYSSGIVLGLVAALIVAALLAVVGFALFARARRSGRPASPQPWTPPAATPTPAAATDPSPARPPLPTPAATPPAAGSAPAVPPGAAGVPDWSEE